MSKSRAILDLLSQGLSYPQIAARVGVAQSYVRGVRSRYSAADAETFARRWENSKGSNCNVRSVPAMTFPPAPRTPRPPRERLGYRPRPTGQPQEELRELALMLYHRRETARLAGESQ